MFLLCEFGIVNSLTTTTRDVCRSLDSEDVKRTLGALLASKQPACEKSYSPQFVRLVPPIMPVDDEVSRRDRVEGVSSELNVFTRIFSQQAHWIHIADEPSFSVVYDRTTLNIETPDNEARLLMERALKGMLTQNQQHQLINQLESDPQLIYRIGLTPKQVSTFASIVLSKISRYFKFRFQFPELVENNPLIAVDVLLKLMQCKHITEYFSVLVNMEMSLHSMEVVNRFVLTY